MDIKIPGALKIEHEELHAQLSALSKAREQRRPAATAALSPIEVVEVMKLVRRWSEAGRPR